MNREFAYNISILLLINLLVKPFYSFGIQTQVINQMMDYGLYNSLFSLVFLHQFINDPGIQNFNTIYIAENKGKLNDYFQNLIGLKFFLLVAMTCIAIISFFILKYNSVFIFKLIGIAFFFSMSTIFVLLRSSLSAIGQYRTDTWFSALDRLLLIIVIGSYLLIGLPVSMNTFIIIQIVVYLACFGLISYQINKAGYKTTPKISLDFVIPYLKKCLPFATIILLTAIVMRADGVLIERLLNDGVNKAKIYASVYAFIDTSNMFGFLFGGLLLPMFSNKINAKESIRPLFRLAFKLLITLSLIIGLTFFFYSSEILSFFYTINYGTNMYPMKIFLLCIIPIALTNCFGPILLAVKNVKWYNYSYLFVVLFLLIMNFIFIRKYELYATAIISLTSWTLILILMIFFSIKSKQIDFQDIFNIRTIILIISLITIIYLCYEFIDVNFIFRGILGGLMSLGISYLIFRDELKLLKN